LFLTHICLNIIPSSYFFVFHEAQMTHWLNQRNF